MPVPSHADLQLPCNGLLLYSETGEGDTAIAELITTKVQGGLRNVTAYTSITQRKS